MEYIYIMKPDHANVYKIGQTVNLDNRIKALNRKFDFKLEYVHTAKVKDSFRYESAIHLELSRYHLGGDWFALEKNILRSLIKYMNGVSENE